MSEFDLVIRGGVVATGCDTFTAEIGIRNGIITALGSGLTTGAREIDARERLCFLAESTAIATSNSVQPWA